MSHSFYNEMWQQAIESLSHLVVKESPPPPSLSSSNEKKRTVLRPRTMTYLQAIKHFSELYIGYIQVYRKLEDCYDQIVHPQKRRDIRNALDVVMCRIAQLKDQLYKYGYRGRQSDYVNVETMLKDMNLQPSDLDIVPPRCFADPRVLENDDEDRVKQRHMLHRVLNEHSVVKANEYDDNQLYIPQITVQQAIRIIQRHERGRQGVMRAYLMKELRNDAEKRAKQTTPKDPEEAAIMIQRIYRGHLARTNVTNMRNDELVFLGMRPKTTTDESMKNQASTVRQTRKIRQVENELKYAEGMKDLDIQLLATEGPSMKDEMWEERYQWWIRRKEATGKFPTSFTSFYKEKKEAEARAAGLIDDDSKKKKGRRGGMLSSSRTKPKSTRRGGNRKNDADNVITIMPPSSLGPTQEVIQRYYNTWAKLDETENLYQTHDEEIAKAELRPSVLQTVQADVDRNLLQVLDNLKTQAGGKKKKKKKKKKTKPSSPPPPATTMTTTTKKKKISSAKKKKKKKKCCDAVKHCVDMSLEDMVTYLAQVGVLRGKIPSSCKQLPDFVGSLSTLQTVQERAGITVNPTMWHIRQCINEYVIFPLGSAYVRQNAPQINSLLLYGPNGVGKTMLTRAIAGHTNATYFDLSPNIIQSLMTSKTNTSKLVHMTFQVARAFQPAVIMIDDVEKVFTKSKKNFAPSDVVAKLRKSLVSHKDSITTAEHIIVVGNSSQPFADKVDDNEMKKCFSHSHKGRMLYVPCPSYDTRLSLWQHFIEHSGANYGKLLKNPNFSVSLLAHASEGYSSGSIAQAVRLTLPPHRIENMKQTDEVVDSSEFLTSLSKTPYTYKEILDKFTTFTSNISEKKRAKNEEEAERIAAEQSLKRKKVVKKAPQTVAIGA